MTWEQEMKEQVKERAEVLALELAEELAEERAEEMAQERAEELAEELAQERAEELAALKDIETARKLLGMALALEQIADVTGLPLAQVEQLRQEASAAKA